MNTGWNCACGVKLLKLIINLLGNEYWLELQTLVKREAVYYKPTGK